MRTLHRGWARLLNQVLADATTCQRVVRGHIQPAEQDDAERLVDSVIVERCLDFGGDEVDAPVESVDFLSVRIG